MPITIDGSNGITQAGEFNSDSSFGFKNRIINGAMAIDQRNAGASVTPASGNYTLDRWAIFVSQSSKLTIQQNAGSVTPPAGFNNYLGVTSSSAYSITSSDFFNLYQVIEGYNVADLNWGTANAKTITISFWVRSSGLTYPATFGGALQNDGNNRSYPFTYTISSANTWEQKTVTIAGDTSGTWLTTSGAGLRVFFGLGLGSNLTGTAGSWSGSTFYGANGATSVVGTNGATFYITGVQLEVGSTATSFDYRPYGTELALCQRYCYVMRGGSSGVVGSGYSGSSATRVYTAFPVTMRAEPTLTNSSAGFYTVKDGGGAWTATAIALSYIGTQSAGVQFSASGLTSNYATLVYANSTSAFLNFSAEL